MLDTILIFFCLLRLLLYPSMCYILCCILVLLWLLHLFLCILLLLDGMFYRKLLSSYGKICPLRPVSLLIFCLDILSIDISGVLKSLAITVLVSTSPISMWYKLNTFYSATVLFHWFITLFFCNKHFQQ